MTIGATLETLSTRKDGSIKLVFETQELGPDDAKDLFAMRNRFGLLIFVPEGTKEIEAPEMPARPEDSKSPSQRLRDVLYVLHTKRIGLFKHMKTVDFDTFYRRKMEKIISEVKEEIDRAP